MLSRLPKIGAFTLLSLSIAACSSNNHNNNDPLANFQPDFSNTLRCSKIYLLKTNLLNHFVVLLN